MYRHKSYTRSIFILILILLAMLAGKMVYDTIQNEKSKYALSQSGKIVKKQYPLQIGHNDSLSQAQSPLSTKSDSISKSTKATVKVKVKVNKPSVLNSIKTDRKKSTDEKIFVETSPDTIDTITETKSLRKTEKQDSTETEPEKIAKLNSNSRQKEKQVQKKPKKQQQPKEKKEDSHPKLSSHEYTKIKKARKNVGHEIRQLLEKYYFSSSTKSSSFTHTQDVEFNTASTTPVFKKTKAQKRTISVSKNKMSRLSYGLSLGMIQPNYSGLNLKNGPSGELYLKYRLNNHLNLSLSLGHSSFGFTRKYKNKIHSLFSDIKADIYPFGIKKFSPFVTVGIGHHEYESKERSVVKSTNSILYGGGLELMISKSTFLSFKVNLRQLNNSISTSSRESGNNLTAQIGITFYKHKSRSSSSGDSDLLAIER